ncbi:MAG: T9SS type A sorting domain-containing protein [Bacteroidetes bacterium]|nr:T9SS type A sorting domain-containing protein [Bacteroidota bacterium]
MKRILFIIAFLIFAKFGFSQTNVSGSYFTNTTWNISGSPYNVVGDVQIPSGVTLAIEPDVQINFTGDYEILIKGIIIANGTNLTSINFVGNTAGKAMIMFKSTNLSNSQLSDVKFTGPKNAFQLADETGYNQDPIKNSGVLIVKNVALTNTKVQTKGYQTSASLVIDSATISNTVIKGVYPRSETIDVKNSDITNCTITSDSYNYGITLNNCLVTTSNFTIGCCGANFTIIKSTVQNSNFSDYNDSYGITVIESQIINSPMNLPRSSYGFNVSSSSISYNGAYAIKCYKLNMTCTTIDGNGSGTGIELLGGNNIIHNSTIINNNVAVKNNSNNSNFTIDFTNMENNVLYNIQNLSTANISANNNWWGTTDLTAIANEIYDYYDNINYGVVNFSNYLYNNFDSPSCPDSLTFPISIPENMSSTISSVFDFKIYPNPSSDYVNLEFENSNNEYEDVIVEIVNPMGQILFVGRLNKSTNTQIIDVSSYNKGIYFCNLRHGQVFKVKKMLVQ